MTNDSDAILDDILSRWHVWQQAARVGRGHADRAMVCGENYRPSRQYDDSNGKLDDDLNSFRCKAVDFAVSGMDDPWRAAVYVNARNLSTGREVWRSPRLPEDKAQRTEIVKQARGQLVRLLMSAGVM